MLTNKYVFNSLYPSSKSIRLLMDCEKDRICNSGLHIYSISVNDPLCIGLNVKIGDMVCIRDNTVNFYRKVV